MQSQVQDSNAKGGSHSREYPKSERQLRRKPFGPPNARNWAVSRLPYTPPFSVNYPGSPANEVERRVRCLKYAVARNRSTAKMFRRVLYLAICHFFS
jgi:hypothetical protein